MKINYYTQRDSFSCGPVAILNTLIWTGKKYCYKKIPEISDFVKCKPVIGTQSGTLTHKFLRKEGIKIKKIVAPTKKEIDDHFKNGGAILLRYVRSIDKEENIFFGHYALFYKKTKKGYWGANIKTKKSQSFISEKKFEEYLKVYWDRFIRTRLPWVWLVYRD